MKNPIAVEGFFNGLLEEGIVEYDRLENSEFAGFSVGPLIRRDGDGVTYDAVGDGIRVRLKVLHPSLSEAAGEPASLYFEALDAAEATRHENLVNVESTGESDGLRFAVLEFVEGPALAELLGGHGPLKLPAAADILGQIFQGLQVLHEAGIVHGSIRPDRIVQGPEGSWKIDGFGFPAWRLSESGLDLPEEEPVPAVYLSPEHVTGTVLEPGSVRAYAKDV